MLWTLHHIKELMAVVEKIDNLRYTEDLKEVKQARKCFLKAIKDECRSLGERMDDEMKEMSK